MPLLDRLLPPPAASFIRREELREAMERTHGAALEGAMAGVVAMRRNGHPDFR